MSSRTCFRSVITWSIGLARWFWHASGAIVAKVQSDEALLAAVRRTSEALSNLPECRNDVFTPELVAEVEPLYEVRLPARSALARQLIGYRARRDPEEAM